MSITLVDHQTKMLKKMSSLFPILFLILAINYLECEGIRPTFRLPTTIDPLLYSIKLHPNIDDGSFTGEVLVRVKVKNTVESVLLHSKELNINSIHLNQQEVSYNLHPEYEMLEIFRDYRSIPAGIHNVHIKFDGSLLNKTTGLYRATLTGDDGVKRYIALSTFNPYWARKAFPCFDEPAFKAKFQVTLIAPNESYVALSSTDELISYETSHGIVHKFKTTGLMSPFSLGFSLGQYTSVKVNKQEGPTSIRMYSFNATDRKAMGLAFVPKILAFYTEYTKYDVRHALPKIDFVEYDDSRRAMRLNWGLVPTSKGLLSTNLIFSNACPLAPMLLYILSQFWFGYLVTNNWWSDDWLHNGFGMVMAEKAQNVIFPDIRAVDCPPLRNLLKEQRMFEKDQRGLENAVVTYLEDPNDQHFSKISTLKGAAVLVMLEAALGEDNFQEIVQAYFQTFAYATVTTHDFISLVERSHPSMNNLRDFLESFLYQKHFPIIEVAEIKDGYTLKQISSGINDTQSRWTIPITYNTDLERNRSVVWFDKNMDELFVPKGEEKWIMFDYNNDGYYKISYSASMWDKFYMYCKEMEDSHLEVLVSEAVILYDLDIISCRDMLTHLIRIGTKCKKVLYGKEFSDFLYEIRGYDSDETLKKINEYAKSQWKKEPTEWNYADFFYYLERSGGYYKIPALTSKEQARAKVKSCIDWAEANFTSPNDDS